MYTLTHSSSYYSISSNNKNHSFGPSDMCTYFIPIIFTLPGDSNDENYNDNDRAKLNQ